MHYEFSFVGLEPAAHGCANVHLRSPKYDLRIRLSALDAQALSVELAGFQTARSRLMQFLGRLVHNLDAQITAVQIERSVGNVVEAQVVLTTALDQRTLPISFGDAIAVARGVHVPIHGNDSLLPLMQAASDAVYEVPTTVEAFLNSLSDA